MHQSFRRDYAALPLNVQRRAKKAYRRFLADPFATGLQFKQLNAKSNFWSVRISNSYRAVGLRKNEDEIIWFFIGTHAEYDKLIANL